MKEELKNKRYKKWWWKWLKPKGWDIDLMILKLAETNKANERFVEQKKKEILEKYFS